jgi:hypothetical protein
MVLSLPDGSTATVGEMRGYTASERQALIQRDESLRAAEAGLTQRVNRLREAGVLDDQLNPVITPKAEREVRQTITAQTGISEDDPLFGPLLSQVKREMAAVSEQMKSELQTLSNSVKQIGGVTQQAVKGYLGDHYDQVYRSAKSALPESLRDKYPLDKVIEYATQHQLTDPVGRLNIARALEHMSWDEVKASQQKDFESSRKRLEEDRQTLAQMGRPQPGGPRHNTGFKGVDDKGKTLSLDQALAAAANDNEIWEQAAKSAGLVQ